MLKVAIVGSGPAAFYAADALLREDPEVRVDMFERLPTPYGLVRHGVAPDHQKIKSVVRGFAETAANERFRFFGNVEYGRDLGLRELGALYHAVLFATGAQSDRRMEIPGEDLHNSHPATEFVAWYNGHPDYRHCCFDLTQERVAIVGVGNVAIDVARILCLSADELRRSDIAPHALRALAESRVREVHLLGRRGPAQAAFTNPELKELGELAEADLVIDPAEAALDSLSREEVERRGDRPLERKVELVQALAARPLAGKPRQLHLRFFVAPQELIDDGRGAVAAIRMARTRLALTDTGTLVARPTGEEETLEAGLVFRSVGYRGVPVPGLPFNERRSVVHNVHGRVCALENDAPIAGVYVAGWIKRGPTGVIGTNKPDAVETVAALLEDAAAGRTLAAERSTDDIARVLRDRGVRYVTFDAWRRMDAAELAAGAAEGRPRVKLTTFESQLAAAGLDAGGVAAGG